MNAPSLDRLFRTHIAEHGSLTLNAALLPEGGELAEFVDPEAGKAAAIVLENPVPTEATDRAEVRGTVSILSLTNVPVLLIGGGDDSSTWLRLEISGLPKTWRLTESVPEIPDYWSRQPGDAGETLTTTFFSELNFIDPVLAVVTEGGANEGEGPGLNLRAGIALDTGFAEGIAGAFFRFVAAGTELPVRGSITLGSGKKPPTVDLRATIDEALRFELGSFRLTDTFLWLRTKRDRITGTQVSEMSVAGSISIGTPNPMSMTISAELIARQDRFMFVGVSEDKSFSLGNGLADVAALLGIPEGRLSLPPGLEGLSTLYIKEVSFAFDTANPGLAGIAATLALPLDPPWQTPIPRVAVRNVELDWSVLFIGETHLEGQVRGLFRFGEETPVDILVSASYPDFVLTGEIDTDSPNRISVSNAISWFVEVPELPEISIAEARLVVGLRKKEFNLSGIVESDWSFPVGSLGNFALTRVRFGLERSAESGFAGSIGGEATLGTASLNLGYSYPGHNLEFEGKLPSVTVGEIVSTLTSNALTIPEGVNFTLKDSTVAIRKEGGDYRLFLQTEIEDVGTIFFNIQRSSTEGWGAAVGVDLTAVRRLGELKGFEFLNVIDLTLERIALVLASVDLPSGYTFPKLRSAEATSDADTRELKIPTGIGKPKRGVNFYARFAFGDRAATRNEPLLKLYDFFDLKRVELDVAIQIGIGRDDLSALFLAGGSVQGEGYGIGGGNSRYNMELAAYLAIEYKKGSGAIFLRGLFRLAPPDGGSGDRLTFAAELGLQVNGFYVAGSMQGSWRDPFGIQGLTVSDIGLMVGVTWEGVPAVGFAGTLTACSLQGSLACVVNSGDPPKSVLAGSLSTLSLGEILSTFVGIEINPEPTAREIIAVLRNIAVEGINEFTLPSSLGAALDEGDLKAVASAFSNDAKTPLSSDSEETLLVVGIPGSNWFVTDKRSGITHYGLVHNGTDITVREQAQLYLAPSDARIGTLEFPEGYRITGQLNLFGFKQLTDVTISMKKGIGAEVRMSRINLFGGLLRIERAPGDDRDDDRNGGGAGGARPDGPYVSIATFDRPSRPAPYNTPHVFISGSLSFLGLVDQTIDASISEQGIHVEFDRKVFGTQFNFMFDFRREPLSLAGSGTAGLKISPTIDLTPFGLGTYHLFDIDTSVNLSFGAGGERILATATGHFSFTIPGFGLKIGPYAFDITLVDVDQPLAKLKNLAERAIEGLGVLAEDLGKALLADAKRFAKLVEDGVITIAGTLDDVLKKVFNISLADLYASTQCFAGTRLAPHMMRPVLPYTPMPGEEFQARQSSPDDPLQRLRELRDDLGDSRVGKWVLDIYNTLSQPLVNLYDWKPENPRYSFANVLERYDGYGVFNDLQKLLMTAGSSRPFVITPEFLARGQRLVANIINLAAFYAKSGDPNHKRDGELIVTGITGLLEHVRLLEQLQGLSYEQMKEKIRTMEPPPSPFK